MSHRSHRSSVEQEPDGHYVVRFSDLPGHSREQRFETKREAKWFARAIREWPSDEPLDDAAVELLVADQAGLLTRNIGREMALARRFDSSN